VAALIERQGFAAQRRSDNQAVRPTTEVWLGDSMGEMFAYQGAGDVIVIGGSFLQYGGQNLLEACSVGKPVIVGPYMFNFSEATQLALDANAAMRASSMAEAVLSALALLGDPQRRQKMGESGQALMRIHQGATERVLGVLGL
jgi:3-deoxy-D-manno-octulosonic-acid transferase